MYYNVNEEILLRKLPKNLIKPDGSLFINFDKADINILSNYGYYIVRNDNNEMPENCEREDIKKRSVILDKPYADITRVWIAKPKEADNVL